ncbi:unnamed protein product [Schistosoma margrebowiei]|uniref:Uncharacterized protein n=1 Tax=Schistosoma margrebowiei TaxID=48269 RepID=A0A183NB01_9TREM|nr:unnamed protein product [Schistosoma margrebowiei]
MGMGKGTKRQQNGVQSKLGLKVEEQMQRDQLFLWKSPLLTLYYFVLECIFRFAQLRFTVLQNKTRCVFVVSIILLLFFLDYFEGPHSHTFGRMKSTFLWWSWWVWLGFLSSCGFGTGLHTFVLYLGPFIAEVTMSAYECKTLDFPRPPYPDRIVCPDNTNPFEKITFWKIMRKVQMESIMKKELVRRNKGIKQFKSHSLREDEEYIRLDNCDRS